MSSVQTDGDGAPPVGEKWIGDETDLNDLEVLVSDPTFNLNDKIPKIDGVALVAAAQACQGLAKFEEVLGIGLAHTVLGPRPLDAAELRGAGTLRMVTLMSTDGTSAEATLITSSKAPVEVRNRAQHRGRASIFDDMADRTGGKPIALSGRVALSAGVAYLCRHPESERIPGKYNDSLVQLLWLPKDACTEDWHPALEGRFAIASFEEARPMPRNDFQTFLEQGLRADKGHAYGVSVHGMLGSAEVKEKKRTDVSALFRVDVESMKLLRPTAVKEQLIKKHKEQAKVEIFVVQTAPPEAEKAHMLLFEKADSVFKVQFEGELDYFDWVKRGKPKAEGGDENWLRTVQKKEEAAQAKATAEEEE